MPIDLDKLSAEVWHLVETGSYIFPSRASNTFHAINVALAELREARAVLALCQAWIMEAGPDVEDEELLCRLAALLEPTTKETK